MYSTSSRLFHNTLYFFLSFLVFTTIISVVFHPTLPQAFAAGGRLGTHLAMFDSGSEISIMNMIRSKVSNVYAYPVTINIPIDASPVDIQKLADAAKEFAVIVRVTGVNSALTSQQTTIAAFVQNMNATTWATPSKPVVVFGNELNNLEVEWQDTSMSESQAGTAYANMFALMTAANSGLSRTKYDLSATTVDPYNGVYGWKEFVTAAQSAYSSASGFAVNLYENSTSDGESTIATLRAAMRTPGNRIVASEWGPKDPKSPLSAYVAFYTANQLPKQTEFGTVLLPNYCDTTKPVFGTYFYIEGKIYDITGKEIDPATCATTNVLYGNEATTVDKEVSGIYVYKDIMADMQKFGYGTDRGKQAGASRAARYIMMCAPQFWIGAQVDGDTRDIYMSSLQDKVTQLQAYCAGADSHAALGGTDEPNCLFDPIQGNFTVLNQNISTPLYRKTSFNADGQQLNSNRAESFETFFGLTTKQGRQTGDFVLQSPNKRIVSQQSYCAQTVSYLRAIQILCEDKGGQVGQANTVTGDKIQKPTNGCALNNEFTNSAGNTKQYVDVYNDVTAIAVAHGSQNPADYCALPTDQQNEQVNLDLAQVQPFTKNAFKIGYLIYYNTGRYKRKNGKGLNNLRAEQDCDAFWTLTPGGSCDRDPLNGARSKYFHPVYRDFQDLFGRITFDIIPFLVPANVFSSAQHQELLVNPAGGTDGTDYAGLQNAVFDSPYYATYKALMPQSAIDKEAQKEQDRKTAIGAAMDGEGKSQVGGRGWNEYNEKNNDKRYIYCPLCEAGFPMPGNYPPDKETRDMIPFATVIWNRINAGIFAKEFTEKLQTEGYDAAKAAAQGADPTAQGADPTTEVAIPPDDWATCNVAPQLVRGESATVLNAKGSESSVVSGKETLWGTVKDSVTKLNAIVRDPSASREDKYAYYVRGFLLLPQEYGLLMHTELDLMNVFLSQQQADKILIDEQKRNDFGSFQALANPSLPGYDNIVPPFNRFLRVNGQIFQLEDKTLSTTGKHGRPNGDAGTDYYYTESAADWQARIRNNPECRIDPNSEDCQRKFIYITAKLNSWDPGFNEGKADYRPILPGGWLARGVFELMAHVIAPVGDSNYQEIYCGLEDYWLGGNCGGTLVNGMLATNGGANGTTGGSCLDATTPATVTPGASPPSGTATHTFFQSSTLNDIITQAANWAGDPPAVIAAINIMEGTMQGFTDAQIKAGSTPDGYIQGLCVPSLDGCGSMGPMQFTTLIGKNVSTCPQGATLNTWNVTSALTGVSLAYTSVVAGARTTGTPNVANVVDSEYAAAAFVKSLSNTSSATGWGTQQYLLVGKGYNGSSCIPGTSASLTRLYDMLKVQNYNSTTQKWISGGEPTSDQTALGALTYCEFLELYATPRQ